MGLHRLFSIAVMAPLLVTMDVPRAQDQKCVTMPRIVTVDSSGSPSGTFVVPARQTGQINILSMNIQNMPFAKMKNGDYKKNRIDCLEKLSEQFDLVAFQEDFLSGPAPAHFTRWRPDHRSLFLKNASGLSLLSPLSLNHVGSQSYSICYGSLLNKGEGDCLSRKGFQTARLGDLSIVNTHLDAGKTPLDQTARYQQLQELSRALPANGPLLILGDFNLKRSVESDDAQLNQFLKKNNLTLYLRYSPEKGNDIIAGRDLEIINTAIVPKENFSDHDGLVITAKIKGYRPSPP